MFFYHSSLLFLSFSVIIGKSDKNLEKSGTNVKKATEKMTKTSKLTKNIKKVTKTSEKPKKTPSLFVFFSSPCYLVCVCRPTPKVKWTKKDGDLEKTSGQVDDYGRQLRFYNITEGDDGEYECRAFNDHGSTSHRFTLSVEGRNTQTVTATMVLIQSVSDGREQGDGKTSL